MQRKKRGILDRLRVDVREDAVVNVERMREKEGTNGVRPME